MEVNSRNLQVCFSMHDLLVDNTRRRFNFVDPREWFCSNCCAFADELFESVRPFCGVGALRINKSEEKGLYTLSLVCNCENGFSRLGKKRPLLPLMRIFYVTLQYGVKWWLNNFLICGYKYQSVSLSEVKLLSMER